MSRIAEAVSSYTFLAGGILALGQSRPWQAYGPWRSTSPETIGYVIAKKLRLGVEPTGSRNASLGTLLSVAAGVFVTGGLVGAITIGAPMIAVADGWSRGTISIWTILVALAWGAASLYLVCGYIRWVKARHELLQFYPATGMPSKPLDSIGAAWAALGREPWLFFVVNRIDITTKKTDVRLTSSEHDLVTRYVKVAYEFWKAPSSVFLWRRRFAQLIQMQLKPISNWTIPEGTAGDDAADVLKSTARAVYYLCFENRAQDALSVALVGHRMAKCLLNPQQPLTSSN